MSDEALIYEHISRRIRELRQSHPKTNRKTTQQELASACGIDRTTLTNIELGNQRPPIVVIYRACNYFGVDLDDLLPGLASIFGDESASVEIGGQVHQVGGDKTAELVRSLLAKSA
jgi:transcriptional regulator with XRE-family HTH domain